jgi:hypothetical protein
MIVPLLIARHQQLDASLVGKRINLLHFHFTEVDFHARFAVGANLDHRRDALA